MSNISIILYEIFSTAQSYTLVNVPNKDFGAVLLHAAIKNRRQNLPSVESFVARPRRVARSPVRQLMSVSPALRN